MKQLKNAGIYVLWCRPTAKCYVGKDSNLGVRAKQHLTLKSSGCKAIHAAIKKHGAGDFNVELIAYPGISPEALCAVEMWKVKQLDAYHNGYNLTNGGDGMHGYKASRQTRQKMSKSRLGKNNPNWGKSASVKTRQKISESLSGENHPCWGKSPSAKTRQKRSKAMLGESNPMYGKPTHNRNLEYERVRWFFVIHLENLPIKEKRKQLYQEFKDIARRTLWRWTCKWESE